MNTKTAAYAAAIWSLIFAVLHIVWAAGFYIGLDGESTRKAFQRTSFLVSDLIVAGICVLAVFVALALVEPWGRRWPQAILGMLAWTGTWLLVVRGGAGVAQAVYYATQGVFSARATFWELWFCLGGLLFGIATWQFRRRAARAAPESA